MSAQHAREHVDCSETLHRLYEYLDGEMTPSDTARIAGHLAACGPCMEQHDVEQMMKALVRRSCAAEVAPEHIRASIVTRITTIRIERT